MQADDNSARQQQFDVMVLRDVLLHSVVLLARFGLFVCAYDEMPVFR